MTKTKRDGREIARQNELQVLKALHKFGWLRTRDLGALVWMRLPGKSKSAGFVPKPIVVDAVAVRMAQITLARLRKSGEVLWRQAPDGSFIYGLTQLSARLLTGQGIPAKSAKDLVRRVSLSHYHHRRIANEISIVAKLEGYRVASEHEIATGQWLGGTTGIAGKKPDVLVRDGKDIWCCEIERSARNQRDYEKLLSWLTELWSTCRLDDPATIQDGLLLKKVIFVADNPFINRLFNDLKKLGWTEAMIASRIYPVRCLYTTETRFLLKQATQKVQRILDTSK